MRLLVGERNNVRGLGMDEGPYPEGVDCCWLASDRKGHLAVFMTGGCGPIPMLALLPDYPLANIGDQLLNLPQSSDVHLPVPMPEPDSFVAWAERGLFIYDWSDFHRTEAYIDEYELIALPYRPLTLDLLPDNLANAAISVRFISVAFQTAWRVNVRAHMTCQEAGK